MKYKIYNEDAVKWAKNYQKAKFHALLCDAPYHLTSITKRFGKKGSAPAKYGTDGVFSRASKGFMGTQWDGGDLAFRPETWEAFGEVLHPGAFGIAFSASRNWHRMAVAIEDAGFILHPTIFLWAQGQGFPKATNIAKQLSKQESEDVGIWKGHRYGLQALKPAVEPIIVFQKPYEGKPIDNIVQTGAGALNIDGGRIPTQDEYVINQFDDGMKPFGNGAGHEYESVRMGRPLRTRKKTGASGNGTIFGEAMEGSEAVGTTTQGRWPANLILTEESAERLDKQSGKVLGSTGNGIRVSKKANSSSMNHSDERVITQFSDVGGASRFFYKVSQQLDESDPVYYCSKVSSKERNAGLEEKNNHPTLKPIDLIRYLATLLLPPVEYAPRRIFIPFSGVASEMIGAGLAGWEHVVGVENDTENGYVDIAEKRLEHWLK